MKVLNWQSILLEMDKWLQFTFYFLKGFDLNNELRVAISIITINLTVVKILCRGCY